LLHIQLIFPFGGNHGGDTVADKIGQINSSSLL